MSIMKVVYLEGVRLAEEEKELQESFQAFVREMT